MSTLSKADATGNRAYSYDYEPRFETKVYTLFEAIEEVIHGALSPDDIYDQLPEHFQKEIELFAGSGKSKSYEELSLTKKIDAFKKLKKKIENYQKVEAELKEISLIEAFKKAEAGKLDDLILLNFLKPEIKEWLNVIAQGINHSNYENLGKNERHKILKQLIILIENSAPSKNMATKTETAPSNAPEPHHTDKIQNTPPSPESQAGAYIPQKPPGNPPKNPVNKGGLLANLIRKLFKR